VLNICYLKYLFAMLQDVCENEHDLNLNGEIWVHLSEFVDKCYGFINQTITYFFAAVVVLI
jgi:hypothetical protein